MVKTTNQLPLWQGFHAYSLSRHIKLLKKNNEHLPHLLDDTITEILVLSHVLHGDRLLAAVSAPVCSTHIFYQAVVHLVWSLNKVILR